MQDTAGQSSITGVMQQPQGHFENPGPYMVDHEQQDNEGVDQAYLEHLASTTDDEVLRRWRPKGVCSR